MKSVMVDNNSTDNTAKFAKNASATVLLEAIQGYGALSIQSRIGSIVVSLLIKLFWKVKYTDLKSF